MGVSKNRGIPKWMVYNGKPNQNWWFGGTIIFGKHLYTVGDFRCITPPFTPRLCPLIKTVGRTGMLVARILAGCPGCDVMDETQKWWFLKLRRTPARTKPLTQPSKQTSKLFLKCWLAFRVSCRAVGLEVGPAKKWESQWGPSWSWSGWLTSFRSCWGDLEESHLVPSRCWGCHLSLFDKSCIYIYRHIHIYMILYWVWPPASISGKRRFIGIPYNWKCNDLGGHWHRG